MIGERAEEDAGEGRNRAIDFRSGFHRRRGWVLLTTLSALVVSSAFVLAVPNRHAGVPRASPEGRDGYSAKADPGQGGEPVEEFKGKVSNADANVEGFRAEQDLPSDPSGRAGSSEPISGLNVDLANAEIGRSGCDRQG